MAKKMQSFRLDDWIVEKAKSRLNNLGVPANKSETVDIALNVLDYVCFCLSDKKAEGPLADFMIRDNFVYAGLLNAVMRNPEIRDLENMWENRFYERWNHD